MYEIQFDMGGNGTNWVNPGFPIAELQTNDLEEAFKLKTKRFAERGAGATIDQYRIWDMDNDVVVETPSPRYQLTRTNDRYNLSKSGEFWRKPTEFDDLREGFRAARERQYISKLGLKTYQIKDRWTGKTYPIPEREDVTEVADTDYIQKIVDMTWLNESQRKRIVAELGGTWPVAKAVRLDLTLTIPASTIKSPEGYTPVTSDFDFTDFQKHMNEAIASFPGVNGNVVTSVNSGKVVNL